MMDGLPRQLNTSVARQCQLNYFSLLLLHILRLCKRSEQPCLVYIGDDARVKRNELKRAGTGRRALGTHSFA